jgi:uncharacterized protein DUF4136
MQKVLQCSLILILAALVSCGPSLKVTSDYDKSVNFGSFKKFAIYQNEAIHDAISQLNQDRVWSAIKSEMVKKGFTEDANSPDVLVNAVAIFQDKVSVSSNTNYYGYGGYYRPYSWGGGMAMSSSTNYDVHHYKDGSLIIDVIDAASKKLVWQGTGNKEIDGPIKDPDVKIPKLIESIMAEFPPGAGKKSK